MYTITASDRNGRIHDDFLLGIDKPASFQEAFEPLFKKFNVDLYMCGHVHGYERQFPVFQDIPERPENPAEFKDPNSTIYVINGAGGNDEGFSKGTPNYYVPWNVFNEFSQWGYGILEISQQSYKWEFFNTSKVAIDSFTVRKTLKFNQ